MARLTEVQLRALAPGAEVGEVDLRLRKNNDGTATAYVRPRVGGKRPEVVLGRWPEKRLGDLRDGAREALKAAKATPPAAKEPPRGPTLREALESYRDRRMRQNVR